MSFNSESLVLIVLSLAPVLALSPGHQAFGVAELRAAIWAAASGSRVSIPAGVYDIGSTPIRIQGKRNVQIVGAGEGKTIIRAGASAPFSLELAGSNENLTVANMSLEGAANLSVNTHALASGNDRMNLTGARFHDLDIRNVAVGISVAGTGTGICNDVQILRNHLDNIQDVVTPAGLTSGSGYGIHNDGCSEVRIADNVIRNADRHSIYQASAYQPDRPAASGSVVIEHNLIIDHARTSSLHNDWLVAIVVARSANVVVQRNVIVNPYHDALSIEDASNEGRKYDVRNVSLIDNAVIGSHGADVFLTAAGSFVGRGNQFYHSDATGGSSAAFVRRDGAGVSGKLIDDGGAVLSGADPFRIDPAAWSRWRARMPGSGPLRGMASFDDKLYVYSGSCFYEASATTFSSSTIAC